MIGRPLKFHTLLLPMHWVSIESTSILMQRYKDLPSNLLAICSDTIGMLIF